MKKLTFPSQERPYTGSYGKNRWRRNVDLGKALEDWKAMNDKENERRAAMGSGTQSLPINQINTYHDRQLTDHAD